MLSCDVRLSLRKIGIFPKDDPAGNDIPGGFAAIFKIDPDSDDPSLEEMKTLEELSKKYRSSHFSTTELRNRFWGAIANTIILKKKDGAWSFRRSTWTNPSEWAPRPGVPIEHLFGRFS